MQQRIVGEKHLKLVLATDASRSQLIDAIAFNVDTDRWPDPAAGQVRLIYKLDINLWRGRSPCSCWWSTSLKTGRLHFVLKDH